MRDLLSFRSYAYMEAGVEIKARSRECAYRSGGQQMPYIDKYICLYAESQAWQNWVEVAADRNAWQRNETPFVQFALHLISKER